MNIPLWPVLVGVLLFVAKLVVEHEYWWFAKKLGQLTILASSCVLPKAQRHERRAEWLAELDASVEERSSAVGFALGTLAAAVSGRVVALSAKSRGPDAVADPDRFSRVGVIGPIELVITTNYDSFVEDALKGGWTVSRTAGSTRVLLSRSGQDGLWFRIKNRDRPDAGGTR